MAVRNSPSTPDGRRYIVFEEPSRPLRLLHPLVAAAAAEPSLPLVLADSRTSRVVAAATGAGDSIAHFQLVVLVELVQLQVAGIMAGTIRPYAVTVFETRASQSWRGDAAVVVTAVE